MPGPFTTPVAQSTPFDNDTNSFVADNVQEAIEETLTLAPGKARASVQGFFNGTVANDQWLTYSNLAPGNNVPIPVPWDCTLEELTFSFDRSSVRGTYSLYLNGTGGGDIVHTVAFSNVDTIKIDLPALSLSNGDLLRGRWTDSGQNPRDMAIVMFFLLD